MTDDALGAAGIRVGLLGPVDLRAGGLPAAIPQPAQRLLLAILAISSNQVVSAGRLIEALWQEELTRRRVKNLHTQIYQLRRQFSGLEPDRAVNRIVTQPPGYKLILGTAERDVDLAEQLVADARAELRRGDATAAAAGYRQALALWRGPALADIIDASPPLRAAASQLDERRLTVLSERIEADLALGLQDELVSELTGLAAQFPLWEKARCQLMVSLYRCGRRADALAVYHLARTALADELGLDPGPELTALHQRILTDDPALTPRAPQVTVLVADGENGGNKQVPRPPAQLPPTSPDFTGRDQELAYLSGLLRASELETPGSPAVVVITGPGGIGKSALAVRAAHELREQFPDGQLFASLSPAADAGVTAYDVQARLLRQLGREPDRIPADAEERTAEYRTATSGMRLLIVLDDAQEAAQVRLLLPATMGSMVLVTSRSWLPALEGSSRLAVSVLGQDAGRDLFRSIVGARRTAAEPAEVDEILRACGGLPLAIRIAASRLATRRSWTIRTLADKLADENRRLDVLQSGDAAVRASIGVSYGYLDQVSMAGDSSPAAAFRMLALTDGPAVGLGAAAALLRQDRDQAESLLEILVDANLLESPAPGRYQFHELTRIFAAERCLAQDDAASRSAAVRRLLEYYLRSAQSANQVITPRRRQVLLGPPPADCTPLCFNDRDRALAWLDSERLCLVAAVARAAREELDELAWQLPITLWDLFSFHCYLDDWVATHRTGLAAARRLGDRHAEAWLLNHLAVAYQRIGRPEAAAECHEQALPLRRASGDQRGEATTLLNLGMLLVSDGQVEKARAALQEATAICRRIDYQDGLGGALHHLGRAAWRSGEPAEAARFLQEAVAVLRKINNSYGESSALLDLGRFFLDTGQVSAAITSSQQAITLSTRIHHREAAAYAGTVLAQALAQAGRTTEARQAWAESAISFDSVQDPLGTQISAALSVGREPDAPEFSPFASRLVKGR